MSEGSKEKEEEEEIERDIGVSVDSGVGSVYTQTRDDYMNFGCRRRGQEQGKQEQGSRQGNKSLDIGHSEETLGRWRQERREGREQRDSLFGSPRTHKPRFDAHTSHTRHGR
jgi:hypothetical protein